MILFKGEAKKLSVAITDLLSAPVDPATFENVKIWLYDLRTASVFAKYSIASADGFDTAIIESGKVVFFLTAEQSAAAVEGKAVIQVSLYAEYGGGEDLIDTKKGLFSIVKSAKL